MWIVRPALCRPYTFVVVAMPIAFLEFLSIATMPRDIFKYGLADYPLVIDAERTLRANQLLLAETVNLQMGASVPLIRALGGGWEGLG